jgi:hypothetical protein
MSTRQNRREIKKNITNENGENGENEITVEEINDEQDAELNKYNCNKEIIYDKSYKFVIYCCNFTYNAIIFIVKASGVYLLWIFLHFTASHLYVKLCVPKTVFGFIMSPFMTATPHCQGLRWIVYNAANIINNMWIILGTWLCSTILLINNNNINEESS